MSPKNLEAFGFVNKYGWMNAMKGSKWSKLIQSYQADYKKTAKKTEKIAHQFAEELSNQPSYTGATRLGSLLYEMVGGQALQWRMINENDMHFATDIDVDKDVVWAVEDKSNGAEQYTLTCFNKNVHQWTYKSPVAQFVATIGDRCYCIETENFLWLRRLISLDAKTGANRKIELDIKDKQWNLQLVKGQNHCLFALANNAGLQRCWYRTKSGSWKELEGYVAFVPVGLLDGKVCYFARKQGSTSYEAINCKGVFPSLKFNVPEHYDLATHRLLTRAYGERSVWDTQSGKKLATVFGNIDVDGLPAWHGEKASITVASAGSYRQTLESYLDKTTVCPYAKTTRIFANSKDGTSIPSLLVSSCKPKHLLCIVYGAYGVPTRMSTDRWKPLLDRGWALCIALVRGGGDHTDAWAEAARRESKLRSVEDFEACIRAAQQKFHLTARSTFVYGRSAGGYTVGASLARNSTGSLFTGVYTEVPYVDVLNTTSNPSLPLTQLEYEEFGNPRRLPNAQTLLQLSPIDSLPPGGAPTVFVLSRTASNDKEVFAYESVKWITQLRTLEKSSPSAPKLLAFTEGEGHFSSHETMVGERAADMAILHSWLLEKKSHQGIYTMANTRRNNASRKRRNNMTARKNNVTMGGKRRKSGRKSTRRHRKH